MWGHTEQTGHPALREKIQRDALLSHILTIIDTCIHTYNTMLYKRKTLLNLLIQKNK